MPAKLTEPKNLLNTAIHYGATAGLLGASFALGGPIGLGIATVLTGGISYFVIREQKNFIENNLKEHPKVHRHSPNLGKMADELYKKSGLNAKDHPIYDFRADRSKESKGVLGEIFGDLFDFMGHTHNAAALNLSKPVIMISEPLLKLLDDNEEKAVLAHEFAHAAGHHTRLGMPQKILGGLAATTGVMAKIGAWWSTGVVGIISSVVASTVAGLGSALLAIKVFDKDKVLGRDDDWLDPDEEEKKKKLKLGIKAVTSAVGTAVLTYFNPVYLAVWAGSKAISAANTLISSAYTRSMEYQADEGAVALGADPLALAVGLRKIEKVIENSKKEFYEGNVPKKGELSKMWAKATASHPATKDRVDRLAKMAEKQGVSKTKINAAVHGTIMVGEEHNLSADVLRTLAHGM